MSWKRGRSFERPCKLLGGEHIDFSEEAETLDLSPFNFLDDLDPESEGQVLSLGMVRALFYDLADPKGNLDTLDEKLIDRAFALAWTQKGKQAKVHDVCTLLRQPKTFAGVQFSQSHIKRAKDLSVMMGDYAFDPKTGKKGLWSRYFLGSNKISFKKDFYGD